MNERKIQFNLATLCITTWYKICMENNILFLYKGQSMGEMG